MADRDDEEDVETMVANRKMLAGLQAQGGGALPTGQGGRTAGGATRPSDFPAGLIRTMPMAPTAREVLQGGDAVQLADTEAQGMPPLVINFLLVCGVITAFGLMTFIYLKI